MVTYEMYASKVQVRFLASRRGILILSTSDHDRFRSKSAIPSKPSQRDSKTHNEFPIEQQEDTPVFSSQKGIMDYATIQGIRSRTGIDEKQMGLFVIKELIDNALDFLEKNNIVRKEVAVFVTKEPNYIRIRVLNSTQPSSSLGSTSASLSEDIIRSIFNYDKFYSTKRNLYKISRGALGDALKEVACIPYAIADRYDVQGWQEPLIITNGSGKRFYVRIQIDKLEQTIHSEVKEALDYDTEEEKQNKTSPKLRREIYRSRGPYSRNKYA